MPTAGGLVGGCLLSHAANTRGFLFGIVAVTDSMPSACGREHVPLGTASLV